MSRRVYVELRTTPALGADAGRELASGYVHTLDDATAAEIVDGKRGHYVGDDDTGKPDA